MTEHHAELYQTSESPVEFPFSSSSFFIPLRYVDLKANSNIEARVVN